MSWKVWASRRVYLHLLSGKEDRGPEPLIDGLLRDGLGGGGRYPGGREEEQVEEERPRRQEGDLHEE
jgi:hypothetical protein